MDSVRIPIFRPIDVFSSEIHPSYEIVEIPIDRSYKLMDKVYASRNHYLFEVGRDPKILTIGFELYKQLFAQCYSAFNSSVEEVYSVDVAIIEDYTKYAFSSDSRIDLSFLLRRANQETKEL